MAIYLLRHGESEGNAAGFFQGRIDTQLTAQGRRQAQTAGCWLKQQGISPVVVYTSPLARAADTAAIISAALGGSPPQVCPEIAEFDAGRLEGLPVAEVEREFPEYYTRELEERGDFSPYGGESYEQIQQRLGQFTARFCAADKGAGDTLVVSHGGAIYQLLKLWCGWPVPRHFFNRIGNCTCYKLELREFTEHTAAELQWMVPVELMYPSGGSAA
jgi:broad specificity phosphatase PhoE